MDEKNYLSPKNKLKHLEKKQTIYTFANDFDV